MDGRESPVSSVPGLMIRPCEPSDAGPLEEWLNDPAVSVDFPMGEGAEIHEAARRWVDLFKEPGTGAWTAVYRGAPAGISLTFLQNYERIRHQAVHILLVAKEYRNMGIGTALLARTVEAAPELGIELLHVEVYGNEDVVRFYRKRGFTEFARQQRWTKESGIYRERVCLERFV